MVGSVNKVILVGNVGINPEIKNIQSTGEELATFSIATSEKWKDKSSGELREKTDWHRIVVFSPGLVKIVKEYVHKGTRLYIEGKIQTRDYETSDGIKKYATEIILAQYNSNIVLLNSKKDNTEAMGNIKGTHDFRVSDDSHQNILDKKEDDVLIKDEIPF